MKGTEAWEQHGEPSREEAWKWALLYFSKAWGPAGGGKAGTLEQGGGGLSSDDHCNLLAQGSQVAE